MGHAVPGAAPSAAIIAGEGGRRGVTGEALSSLSEALSSLSRPTLSPSRCWFHV